MGPESMVEQIWMGSGSFAKGVRAGDPGGRGELQEGWCVGASLEPWEIQAC